MKSNILGFWMIWIGWGWKTYPTGLVENMDAAGGLFFMIGSLLVIYNLVVTKLIPIGGVRYGLSLFYIAWGWDWAFWMIAPAGNYLDLKFGSFAIGMDVLFILIGMTAIVYGTYKYNTNPLTAGNIRNLFSNLQIGVKNLNLEKIQQSVGKLVGLSLEMAFLLFGFFFVSFFLDTPVEGSTETLKIIMIIVVAAFLMALGHFTSQAEEQRSLPAYIAAVYILILGLVFLIEPLVTTIGSIIDVLGGEIIAIALLVTGYLLMRFFRPKLNLESLKALNTTKDRVTIIILTIFLIGLVIFIYEIAIVIQAIRDIYDSIAIDVEAFILGILLSAAGILITKNSKDLSMKNYLPGKGMLTGIGCLIAGVFDLYYAVYSPNEAVLSPMSTPSVKGGLFMGFPLLEGIALILVFLVLVILPRQNVPRKTLYLSFIAPLIVYGVSLVVTFANTIVFTPEQFYSIYWTRGIQLGMISGILILIYCALRLIPHYRSRRAVIGVSKLEESQAQVQILK